MILNDERTWPSDVVHYLEAHRELFWRWEDRRRSDAQPLGSKEARTAARAYDIAVYGLRDCLRPHSLHGYHCTRLTEPEIARILSSGMRPPNRAFLCERIDELWSNGLLDDQAANELKEVNQAGESNRAGMIWFCFFPPRIAGQHGIESFFRFWGGEALYNSHDRGPRLGSLLRQVGVPSLVEADVPISTLPQHTCLDVHLYRQFLINRGFETDERCEHEDRATAPIPAENIRRIIRFPEADFLALTRCNQWHPPL
jgi:hypothetical protein